MFVLFDGPVMQVSSSSLQEPDIARDLIRKGLMKRKTCTSFSTKDIYYTWQVNHLQMFD